MSIFRLKPYKEEEPITVHPWAKTIKDEYSHQMKHAHNSINNTKYPKETKEIKEPAPDKVTISVIGDRVVSEFIYCRNLVTGLYKYRPKYFNVPIIRGVTTVEWPDVWRDLKIMYGGLAFCIKSSVAVLVNDKFLGGEKELKELIESKYIYHIHPDYYKEGVTEFAKFIRASGRSCVYMHIAIDNEYIGTLIFMVFSDLLPYTCENFLRLCKETRGGYGGTPVHRIVKDSWIQCGGYGLKSTDLSCENFIIPFDRRGVLGMANDGRHRDCSTQFFVLLQPAHWMAYKYVAFGQLIDGEETLKKIENVPTWYESPLTPIKIIQSGIFNMECHDIMINRGAKEYIQGHIEDLFVIGEMFYEELLQRVFLEIHNRETAELYAEEYYFGEEIVGEIRTTKRFIRKKEDIEKQLSKISSSPSVENNEFDVEEYHYEPEEFSYKHVSLVSQSLEVRPEKPYYIPLTDVPYPGEVDSTFDLKRLLQGHYCLESDLTTEKPAENKGAKSKVRIKIDVTSDSSESVSEKSLDSDEDRELKKYLGTKVDTLSFAGGVIKNIAKSLGTWKSQGRRIVHTIDNEDSLMKPVRFKQVSISAPASDGQQKKIKRRQTGFERPDLETILNNRKPFMEDDDDDDDDDEECSTRKVRIAVDTKNYSASSTATPPARRPTGYVRQNMSFGQEEVPRPSVLARLYEDVTVDDESGPTLKDFKPLSESNKKNILLTYSPYTEIRSAENTRQTYARNSALVDKESFEHVLNIQHGKKMARKISSDYVKTIDQIEQKVENSIRSIEYAKTRPVLTVSEYQQKNKKYQEELKSRSSMLTDTSEIIHRQKTVIEPTGGLRLPGDTPLYSMTDVRSTT